MGYLLLPFMALAAAAMYILYRQRQEIRRIDRARLHIELKIIELRLQFSKTYLDEMVDTVVQSMRQNDIAKANQTLNDFAARLRRAFKD